MAVSATIDRDQWADPRWRISNLYYITDKSGQRVKFSPNSSQLAYLNDATKSDLILKARQLGFTTLMCVIGLDEAIFLDGEAVGYVSSGGFGPVTGQHIALGYVRPDAWRERGSYAVEIFGDLRAAELQPRPLYDPDGLRMRG